MRNGVKFVALIVVVLALVPVTLAYIDNAPNTGTLKLYVHDAPTEDASAVYITFSSVSIHSNSTGWTNYTVSSQTMNILGISAANATLLKSVSLAEGQYTMIRIYISQVSVMINGVNTTFRLSSPFAFVNGVFTVNKLETTSISVDFILDQSLNDHSRMFTPHIGYTLA